MPSELQSLQSPQDLPEEIELTLLLSGGQEYTLAIGSDNPLLQELFEVLVDFEGTRIQRLFQIPLDNGESVLTFPSHHLMGLITKPPLILQQQPVAEAPPIAGATLGEAASSSRIQGQAAIALPEPPIIPSEFVQLDNFLTPQEQKRLVHYVLQHKSEFVSTSTFTGEQDYRKSIVLYSFPEFAALITQRILDVMGDVQRHLNLPAFSVNQIEAQLTAHNDGHYYRVHNDNGSPDTASRELTYVYYFHREPKPFSGGELLIYDSAIANNFYVQAETFKTVEPRNNSIVFFPSRYMHEVLPIHCPSRKFSDSRFTINGWIRRA